MSATRIHIDGIVLIISLLFVSLLVLLGSSFYALHEDIELQLITDVREQLEEAGYQVSIDFDGRDGTIGGSVPDEQTIQEIVDITKNVPGVRTITNNLTITHPETSTEKDLEMGLLGITDTTDQNTASIESIDNLISSSTSNNTSSENSDINNIATEDTNTSPQNLTEITEQAIIEESTLYYQTDETNLSPESIATLDLMASRLSADSTLYVEMASFYKEPAIAIKRTDFIKKFLEEKGIDKKHADVVWNDSPNKNFVKLRLFHSKN
ncbi:MAG: hypothetical protein DSZ29_05350 [Aquificaceae bacterium]|nr:MAG: hypothetical protein DSZ29_05350 [Aquificaceae bacterium]